MLLALEDDLYIGMEKQLGTTSMEHPNLSVMFVDDGASGYFYAIDTHQSSPIVDSLFVYNVISVEERQLVRKLEICWAKEGQMAFLFINDYPHAAFDFTRLVGYNHSKFPQPDLSTLWSHEEVTTELVKAWLKL